MSPQNIILILGAGPRIGASLASKFATVNYKVALVSRRGTNALTQEGYLSLQSNVHDPTAIPPIFDAVEAHFHAAPNVVVYNTGTLTLPSDKESVLSIPWASVRSDLDANTVSPYAAAQEAVKRWAGLEEGVKKTFIFAGNAMDEIVPPMPVWMTLGIGKSASAFWIGLADQMYEGKGYRFFYADERKEDGTADGNIDGPYHGEFYAYLASHEGKVPWKATFVKDKGYKYFDPKEVSIDRLMKMNKHQLDAWSNS